VNGASYYIHKHIHAYCTREITNPMSLTRFARTMSHQNESHFSSDKIVTFRSGGIWFGLGLEFRSDGPQSILIAITTRYYSSHACVYDSVHVLWMTSDLLAPHADDYVIEYVINSDWVSFAISIIAIQSHVASRRELLVLVLMWDERWISESPIDESQPRQVPGSDSFELIDVTPRVVRVLLAYRIHQKAREYDVDDLWHDQQLLTVINLEILIIKTQFSTLRLSIFSCSAKMRQNCYSDFHEYGQSVSEIQNQIKFYHNNAIFKIISV